MGGSIGMENQIPMPVFGLTPLARHKKLLWPLSWWMQSTGRIQVVQEDSIMIRQS